MTFVVARKFDQRILIATDTMTSSNPKRPRPEPLPGVLKAVVIDLHTSVSFAGSADLAHRYIRDAKRLYSERKSLPHLLDLLSEASKDYCVDFIVASHRPQAVLHVIKKGQVSADIDGCWIGDSDGFKMMPSLPVQKDIQIDPTFGTWEEAQFTREFLQMFEPGMTDLSITIGGFAIFLLGSPNGHTYMSRSVIYHGGEITLTPQGFVPEQMRARAEVQAGFAYDVVAPNERGVAVLGVLFPQPAFGYVYSPIEWDEPQKVSAIAKADFIDLIGEKARALGGSFVPNA